MVKVLIADDHAIIRKGLKQILAETADLVVEDEARDGEEVLRKITEKDYDLLLLDLSMPGIGGLETLKQLQQIKPRLQVLILSVHPEEQYAIRALKAGAAGYLTKESAPQELIAAIRHVSAGGRYVSPALAEKLTHLLRSDFKVPPHEQLSDREFEVMKLIAAGKTVSEIADAISLSVKTVSTYRGRILKKMGLNTNAELTYYAVRNRLLD